MNRWEKHWYGPVAAIRPYLFQRCFLLVVAMDLLVLMTERGSRYGLNAIPFNVPHFKWLDALHHLLLPQGVPTATYYVCVVVITSFLAIYLVLIGHRPWLMAVVAGLYTYAWSMSRLDSYLHHYMITLILSCMVFLPYIDARSMRDWWLEEVGASKVSKRRKKRTSVPPPILWRRAATLLGLAVACRIAFSQTFGLTPPYRWASIFVLLAILAACLIRWQASAWDRGGPLASAWAFRLLATTIGVIYVFTSIAKMDAEWCGGHTLRKVGATEVVLLPVEQLAATLGISRDFFWSSLATFVIPLELSLAACYFLSVWRDEPERKWLQRICACGWVLAVGLHLNNEIMNLSIQWFGYYMLLLASLILLPARILMILGLSFIWPECWLRERYGQWLAKLSNGRAILALGVVSAAAIVGLLLAGYYTWIAGAIVASFILAVGLVIVLVWGMVSGWGRQSIKVALSTLLASIIIVVAVWQCSVRFDYYDLRGKTLQLLGEHQAAMNEMLIAASFSAPNDKAAADLLTNLGLGYRRLGQTHQAELSYRAAIERYPAEFLAHYSLGNLMVEQQRLEVAEQCYRNAIAIKPDFSDALINLGNVFEFQSRLAEAIECYEAAIEVETEAEDIKKMLAAAREKRAASK